MKCDELCTVASATAIGGGYSMLLLDAPAISKEVAPGQFVHVRVPALAESDLRRPFSVFDARGGRIEILFKSVGRGSELLAKVRPGDRMRVAGPLGRGFPDPAPGADALLVAGGYGVAPLHFLSARLKEKGFAGRIVLFAGGRTAADLLQLDRFAALGVECRTATDDGSAGAKGLVTVSLDAALEECRRSGRPFELFACGPGGMLKAVADRAMALGAPGWISMDRHMACGVGACFACTVKTRDPKGGVANARCCVNGPVFKAAELVWD